MAGLGACRSPGRASCGALRPPISLMRRCDMTDTGEQQTPPQATEQTQQPQQTTSQPTALSSFSDQLADAVATASKSIVTVAARPRQSATGVLWRAEDGQVVILTADHV